MRTRTQSKGNSANKYEDTSKYSYKEGVWKKAKPNRSGGGGRMAPIY
jgi:hypothetical protein